MGGKVSVIGRPNDRSNEQRLIKLFKEKRLYNLSFYFVYFMDSQFYNISPFKQIESKLDIDLTLFTRFPHILSSRTINDIRIELSTARYNKDEKLIEELELKLAVEKQRILKESIETLEGWTLINTLIEITASLLSKFMKFDDLESEIIDPDNAFENGYLSKKKREYLDDMRFEEDLEMIIKQLKCYKEAGFDHACIFLYDGKYVGPLASLIDQYDEHYKWKILG